jgi:catechol 2,3-dioxygenase-like lactoylglutathione lyase family enzyme
MASTPFSIQHIDHIKVSVPDRYEAAKWYEQVFSLKILHGPAWDAAAALPNSPLFLGTDDALDGPKLAILEGEPLGKHPPVGLTRASFRVSAESFLRFLDHLDELALFDEEGERVTRTHVVDQWIAWSLYFNDPYGNRYEVLTYEYETVRHRLRSPESS